MNDVNDGDGHTTRHDDDDDISQSVFFSAQINRIRSCEEITSFSSFQARLCGDVCTALQRDIVVMSIERVSKRQTAPNPERKKERESTQKCKHRKVNKPLSLAHCWPANKNC